MSHTEWWLWSLSLNANGLWLGSRVARWSGDDPRRLGRATLGLSLPVIVLGVGQFRLPHGALLTLDGTAFTLAMDCFVCCLLTLADVAPSPWGRGPHRLKAQTR